MVSGLVPGASSPGSRPEFLGTANRAIPFQRSERIFTQLDRKLNRLCYCGKYCQQRLAYGNFQADTLAKCLFTRDSLHYDFVNVLSVGKGAHGTSSLAGCLRSPTTKKPEIQHQSRGCVFASPVVP